MRNYLEAVKDMRKQKYFIGVDGGGTHSRGLVMDMQGRVVCQLKGEGSNVYKLGITRATSNLAALIERMTSGIPDFRQSAAGICCGLAGVIEGQVQPRLLRAISKLGAGDRVELHNDAFLSCFAIAEGKPAIALISGTGSVAFAFDRKRRVVTGGGMGYLFGDEGSGFEIGSRGIRAAVAYAENRGPETALLKVLLEQTGLENISALPARLSSAKAVAYFAEAVHNQAKCGDQQSISIIDQAATSLVDLASSVMVRIGTNETEKIPVGLFGGCLANMDLLRARVTERLIRLNLEVREGIPASELVAAEIARNSYIETEQP